MVVIAISNKPNKPKVEFSKKLCIAILATEVAVILFTCIMVFVTQDLSPLPTLITTVAAATATCLGFYFNKAKLENKIKLMKDNDVKPTEKTFEEDASYEQ